MPIYEYECPKCNFKQELPQTMYSSSEDMIVVCKCGKGIMKRMISQGATHGDEAQWIGETTEFLKDGEPETIRHDPVASRTEYKKLLKEKGLEPVG